MNKLSFTRKGFTLIELLIVVAIIGILAVALVPTISDAPARARDAARKTLVSGTVQAVESHNLDKGGYPAEETCIDADDNDLLGYFGAKAPTSTEVTKGWCTGDKTAPFYIPGADAVSYTVGISLEMPNGNADCDDAGGAGVPTTVTENADNTGNCFAVFRGNATVEAE
jgi:prepilin-type N-terminal cleavage/methylation domain-containing protein